MQNITKEELSGMIGSFSWNFGNQFFIETENQNFVWSDPDYMGDGTIKPYQGTFADWLEESGVEFCRDKGNHVIGNYCGDFELIIERKNHEN